MRTTQYKSATTGDLIPAVVIQLKTLPDFICTEDQWNEFGGLKEWLKSYGVLSKEVIKEHHLLLNPSQFPQTAWEG